MMSSSPSYSFKKRNGQHIGKLLHLVQQQRDFIENLEEDVSVRDILVDTLFTQHEAYHRGSLHDLDIVGLMSPQQPTYEHGECGENENENEK
eukprot:m.9413 g.9413  ORF g.9413 m.9413 type:complete len:92 (-) comp6343_c0_seq2:65-340(-)